MRVKAIGWIAGSVGLLAGAGTAWADDQGGEESMGKAMETRSSDKPTCKDAGVTVAFKLNSEALDQNAKGALDGVATWLKADDKRTLYLEGFADPTGSAEPNLVLSAQRADAVKTYLVEQGVAADRVTTLGKGVEPEIDHLPANGRAVTFLACQSSGPGPAVAELEVPQATPPSEPVEPVASAAVIPAPPPAPKPRWQSGFGWAVMAGGGYTDFTQDDMRDVTNGGGAWDARFIGGMNSIIGFEAAYVGSARSINTLGVTANNPALVSNGFEGNARLNIPIRVGGGKHLLEPYGYAGLGYSYFNISNYNSNTQVLSSFGRSSDNTMTFPAGGGFAYAYKSFIADVRGGWTGVYYDNILNTNLSTNNNPLNNWNVGSQIGFMF
jgi:peptidoglycan-associated lipoprotein